MEGHDDYVNDAQEEQILVDKRLVGQPFFSEYIQKRADDGIFATQCQLPKHGSIPFNDAHNYSLKSSQNS